jgi:hypothetical protein
MFPLLPLIAQLIPELSKALGSDLSGPFKDQVIETVKNVTSGDDKLETVQAKIDTDPAARQRLQKDLEEIALAELKERDRANEEAGRIDLELYRLEADERARQWTEDFQQYQRALQDVRETRAMETRLAEEHSPLAWVAPLLAFALVLIIAYLLRGIMLAREPVINKDVFNVVLGALVTAFTTVVAYYFGSSLGSSKKDDALRAGKLVTPQKTSTDGVPSTDRADVAQSSPLPPPPLGNGSGQPGSTGHTGTKIPQPSGPTPSGRYGQFRQKAPVVMRNLMRDLGLTEDQAAGVLGNIGWECGGFRTLQEQNPVMGGRGGLGWCQWTASRRTNFERFLQERNADFRDDDANYNFLLSELQGPQKDSVRALRQANNVDTATRGFMNIFERPAPKYAHLEDRIGLANLALQEYRRG